MAETIQSTGSLSEKEGLVQSSESLPDSTSRSTDSPWQPIDSAPRGPNIICAYRNEAGKWRRVIGCYAEQFEIEVDNDDIHAGIEEGPAGEAFYAKPGWYEYTDTDDAPLHRIRPEMWHPMPPLPSDGDRSDEPERDAGDLNQSLRQQT